MAEKILNARTQQKHDIEANWDKATNFIPKAGEIIVYDEDAAHSHPRMKIGDGTSYLADLEFLVNIDTTLTKSSAAADAKTVGDAITSINTIIENFDNIIAVDENNDGNVVLKRYNADGSEDSGSGAAAIHAEQHAADGIDPITPEMIGAMPASYVAPVVSVNGYEGNVELTADDVGALPNTYEAPVASVNGKTGVVELTAEDVGAISQSFDASDELEDPAPTDADTLGGKTLLEIKSMLEPIGTVFQWKPVDGSNIDLSTPEAVAAYKGFGTWEQVGGRFLIGADGTYAPGTTGGEATHTLTVDEMPAHTHNVLQGTSGTTGASCLTVTTSTNRSYATSVSTGGGQAHNNMPPWLAVYTWIRIA